MSSLLQTTSRRTSSLMATTTSYRLRSTCPPGTRIASVRQKSQDQRWFRTSTAYTYAQKDAQDKDSLKPRSTEYSKSGGGDQAAATESAFDPSSTSPEESTKKVERESGERDTMDVSPGNPDVNKRKPRENSATAKSVGEAEEGSERSRTSSKGSPNKAGGGKSG